MCPADDPLGVLFDVDGTLVDTNYAHVIAWSDALRSNGYDVPMATLHRTVGQGADRFVESVVGHADERVSKAHSDFYGPRKHDLRPFPRAADLLRTTRKAGLRVVLATSASAEEVRHLRDALDADDAIDEVTSKEDADESKPDPDLVRTALGVDCVCVLTGGIGEAELRDAGAVAVYPDVSALLDDFEASSLGRLAGA